MPSESRSLSTLLSGAIDYAGLFPPAKLDMAVAVQNYAAYRSGENSWALGRFIVPVSRLAEFEKALAMTSGGDEEGWRISALGGSNPERDVAAIFDFNKRHVAMIDAVEFKASTGDEVKTIGSAVPLLLTAFVEIPLEPDPSQLIAMIGKSGLRAKARMGGITPDAFPSSSHIARFIQACVRTQVSFKATAGLHHPLRGTYRLTYEPDSPTGMMYGFLNVFIATGVAQRRGSVDDINAALVETSPLAFQLSDEEITWRKYRLSISGISSLRSKLAMSIGSCSFTEPIDELKTLRLI